MTFLVKSFALFEGKFFLKVWQGLLDEFNPKESSLNLRMTSIIND